MKNHVDGVALAILIFFFVAVTAMGFMAARWRRADNALHLDEWGLGGRSFGTWVTWFLLGGDLYTAYTFIAVPAAIYGAGASGFFAVPYTIIAYPLVFLFLPRLWSVSRKHGYVTSSDFIRGRFGSRACRWPSRSPASWPPCRTSRSNSSASRRCWTWSGSAAATRPTGSSRTCRC